MRPASFLPGDRKEAQRMSSTIEPTGNDPDSVPGDGTPTCPPNHPVKASDRSGLYTLPGDAGYDETVASTCYRNEETAKREGFRHAAAEAGG
jgi:hypothetical protein